MNIQEAKLELIHTVEAYTAKDTLGNYRIPRLRQRPILLMGPPGIGKTAIMEQVAKECQVGLVSYTMTHHTRQSAVGLPLVEKRQYGGREYTVTEYTMSEIVASVYDAMEKTGCREGILFLDEINCVSETLAPVMLQFLQNKTFGGHKVPEGWVIAAAGNPREYNKSVREFDIVTLDRVRRIEIQPDVEAWRTYAQSAGIHQSILSYLACKPDSFYYIHQDMEEKEFVTARGWEDLSSLLKAYEHMELPISLGFLEEFLACERIARDFLSYYLMSQEYRKHCPVEEILEGRISREEEAAFGEQLRAAPRDETFSVTGWLLQGVLDAVAVYARKRELCDRICSMTEDFWSYRRNKKEGPLESFSEFVQSRQHALEVKVQAELLKEAELAMEKEILWQMSTYLGLLKGRHCQREEEIREVFRKDREEKEKRISCLGSRAGEKANRAISFLEKTFGIREEMLSFLTGFSLYPGSKRLLQEVPVEAYERNCVLLQIDRQEKGLRKLFL